MAVRKQPELQPFYGADDVMDGQRSRCRCGEERRQRKSAGFAVASGRSQAKVFGSGGDYSACRAMSWRSQTDDIAGATHPAPCGWKTPRLCWRTAATLCASAAHCRIRSRIYRQRSEQAASSAI